MGYARQCDGDKQEEQIERNPDVSGYARLAV